MNGNSDRMALLAGLRSAGGLRNGSNNVMNQDMQSQYHQQQQLLQQQQAYFMAALQSGQVTPSQAQMFALQQSQMEMQIQQMQLATLAMQEQLLLQQQQQQAQSQTQTTGNARGLKMQQSMDNMDGSQYTRNSALRNLRQAPKPRAVSSGVESTRSLDWQAERMRFTSPPPVDTPTTSPSVHVHNLPEIDTSKASQHHRKTSSLASSASVQSAAVSETGSLYSPNRGPALVLSKPGEECSDDEDDEHTPQSGPTSPSLAASMRAMSFSAAANVLAAANVTEGSHEKVAEKEVKPKKKSKRHTVILSSSLPHAVDGASATDSAEIATSSSDDSSSSGSSSPTSEKSDIASFDSDSLPSAATSATSGVPSSPTDSTGSKENAEERAQNKQQPFRRVVTMPLKSVALNPAAVSFSPAATAPPAEKYPSGLSLMSNPSSAVSTPTQMRIFSAPAPSSGMSSGFNTPNAHAVAITRQPKGVPKESDLAAKNFASMIRRKAVGALRIAATSGGRISPVASPINACFPQGESAGVNHRLSSPPLGNGAFSAFGADLAARAMKRRSQQLTPAQATFGDIGF